MEQHVIRGSLRHHALSPEYVQQRALGGLRATGDWKAKLRAALSSL